MRNALILNPSSSRRGKRRQPQGEGMRQQNETLHLLIMSEVAMLPASFHEREASRPPPWGEYPWGSGLTAQPSAPQP